LYDKISSSKQSIPRLAEFHDALSVKRDTRILLERCVWSGTASGSTCTCSNDISIAENLDNFQQGLSEGADLELAFCAINISSDLGLYVPWYISLQTPPAVHFQGLLKIIFEDRWPGFYGKFLEVKLQHEKRQPPQLVWDLQLPSKSKPPSHDARSLKGLDISLEWLNKPSGVETLFWSFDWSIYVSEPYNRRPTHEILQIVDLTVGASDKHRVTLITTSGDALVSLKRAHDQAVNAWPKNSPAEVEERLTDAMMAYLEAVVLNVTHYLQGSVKLVQRLVSWEHEGYA
jgi:hypothetical protein